LIAQKLCRRGEPGSFSLQAITEGSGQWVVDSVALSLHQKIQTKKNSDLFAAAWQKIATNYCYKSLLLDLRNSLIYKGFSLMAER
jgi:ketopantoate reductase